MRYISNAFSFNMIATTQQIPGTIRFVEVNLYEGALLAAGSVVSVVGHADTANLFSTLLEREVVFNRASLTLNKGDELLLGQYSGPRLPEGATSLPEGATVKWLLLTVE